MLRCFSCEKTRRVTDKMLGISIAETGPEYDRARGVAESVLFQTFYCAGSLTTTMRSPATSFSC